MDKYLHNSIYFTEKIRVEAFTKFWSCSFTNIFRVEHAYDIVNIFIVIMSRGENCTF